MENWKLILEQWMDPLHKGAPTLEWVEYDRRDVVMNEKTLRKGGFYFTGDHGSDDPTYSWAKLDSGTLRLMEAETRKKEICIIAGRIAFAREIRKKFWTLEQEGKGFSVHWRTHSIDSRVQDLPPYQRGEDTIRSLRFEKRTMATIAGETLAAILPSLDELLDMKIQQFATKYGLPGESLEDTVKRFRKACDGLRGIPGEEIPAAEEGRLPLPD